MSKQINLKSDNKLSNDFVSSMYIDNRKWNSVTQYIYYSLGQNSGLSNSVLQQIYNSKDPKKSYLFHLKKFEQELKKKYLSEGMDAKFNQYPELKRMLLDTGNQKIHYISDNKFLGEENGSGQNLIGKILEECRNRYRLEKDVIAYSDETILQFKYYCLYRVFKDKIMQKDDTLYEYIGLKNDEIMKNVESLIQPLKTSDTFYEVFAIAMKSDPELAEIIAIAASNDNPQILIKELRKKYLKDILGRQNISFDDEILKQYFGYLLFEKVKIDRYTEVKEIENIIEVNLSRLTNPIRHNIVLCLKTLIKEKGKGSEELKNMLNIDNRMDKHENDKLKLEAAVKEAEEYNRRTDNYIDPYLATTFTKAEGDFYLFKLGTGKNDSKRRPDNDKFLPYYPTGIVIINNKRFLTATHYVFYKLIEIICQYEIPDVNQYSCNDLYNEYLNIFERQVKTWYEQISSTAYDAKFSICLYKSELEASKNDQFASTDIIKFDNKDIKIDTGAILTNYKNEDFRKIVKDLKSTGTRTIFGNIGIKEWIKQRFQEYISTLKKVTQLFFEKFNLKLQINAPMAQVILKEIYGENCGNFDTEDQAIFNYYADYVYMVRELYTTKDPQVYLVMWNNIYHLLSDVQNIVDVSSSTHVQISGYELSELICKTQLVEGGGTPVSDTEIRKAIMTLLNALKHIYEYYNYTQHYTNTISTDITTEDVSFCKSIILRNSMKETTHPADKIVDGEELAVDETVVDDEVSGYISEARNCLD